MSFCSYIFRPFFSSVVLFDLFGQQTDYQMRCDFIESEESFGYAPIYNEMPHSVNQSCYNASDPCSNRFPFSENWGDIDSVTIRLNFHFMKTGDEGLSFGENDGNCPSCPNNEWFSAYNVANYLVDELNNSTVSMSDYIQYYTVGDTNRISSGIPFLDPEGNPVPNLGDTKMRFELYGDSVFIHEIDEYKFYSGSVPDSSCFDGQIGFKTELYHDSLSLYGDQVLDVFIYDEWFPSDSCRAIRGAASTNGAYLTLANMWALWEQANTSGDTSFFIYNYVSTLWHEIGHTFSLAHTFPSGGGCCDANEAGIKNANNTVFHVTNNTMGYNPHYVTFSPCQLDKMFNNIYIQEHEFVDRDTNLDLTYEGEPLTPAIEIDGDSIVTWDQDMKVTKHIYVRSGSQLNIEAEIRMVPDANIIVERGAMLHVNQDGKITNFEFNCDRWGGIWVFGNPNRNHPDQWNDSFSSDGEDPGRFVIQKGVIENSRWGINSGFYFYLPNIGGNNPFWPSPFLFTTGGYIYADQATFSGSRQSVRFLPYERENKSKFLGCEFGHPSIFQTEVGVVIDRNYGIEFQGCEFSQMQSHGIFLKDASFNIHNNNKFKSIQGTAISVLYTGIYVPFNYLYNIGEEEGNPLSSGNVFEGNNLDIRIESFLLTRRELSIKGNSFESNWSSSLPLQNQTKNIEVFQSHVVIQNNTFKNTYQNISLNCRQSQETKILNNDFINFHTAIWYEKIGNPQKFKHKTTFACNSFFGNSSSGVLIDESGVNNQGDEYYYLDNKWHRDVNDEPLPGVYDIRVIPPSSIDDTIITMFNSPVFTYSVEKNTPLIDTTRPLCNLTTGHSNCQNTQNYDLYDLAIQTDCGVSNVAFSELEPLSLDEIRAKMDSIDQFGENAVPAENYFDLEGRQYRLIKSLVDSLLSIDQYILADSLLSLENDLEYAQHRFGIRLATKEYDQARSYLNSLGGESSEIGDFKTVQHLHLDFLSDSTYTIDSNDINTLETVAGKRHIPSSHARALLSIIDGRAWDPVFPNIEDVDSVSFHFSEETEPIENTTVVYPNPSHGIFTIIPNSKTFDTGTELQIQVFDIAGKRISQVKLVEASSDSYRVNLRDVPDGIYLLLIAQRGHQEIVKIVKQ